MINFRIPYQFMNFSLDLWGFVLSTDNSWEFVGNSWQHFRAAKGFVCSISTQTTNPTNDHELINFRIREYSWNCAKFLAHFQNVYDLATIQPNWNTSIRGTRLNSAKAHEYWRSNHLISQRLLQKSSNINVGIKLTPTVRGICEKNRIHFVVRHGMNPFQNTIPKNCELVENRE